jgi:hypothetical protein
MSATIGVGSCSVYDMNKSKRGTELTTALDFYRVTTVSEILLIQLHSNVMSTASGGED